MSDTTAFAWALIAIVAIIAPLTVVIFAMAARARVRELEIRERIAMIERGLVPPPEADPGGFERRMHAIDRMQSRHAGPRFRSGGVMVMSVGFGLMVLLWLVGVPREAVGVGGFLVIIGFGLLVNSLFSSYERPAPPQRQDTVGTTPPPGPQS